VSTVLSTASLTETSAAEASSPTGGPARCRLGRDVTLLVQDDTARLLDLNRGRFYALNRTGTQLLSLVSSFQVLLY
jgi:hypothetical protein